ncbi:MAG: type II toxin-antitoxin system HicA family toxin [Bacteroidota bacterium]
MEQGRLNTKQRRTLESIFHNPVLPTIRYSEVERLLVSLGCELREGRGSRVRFKLGKERLNLHKPHPAPTLKPYQIRNIRKFLHQIGLTR